MSGEAHRRRLRALLRLAGVRSANDLGLFETAFVHESHAREHGGPSNERMEFLGDSILGFIAADWLFERFPDEPEGLLTQRKAAIVNDAQLARTAHRLGLRGAGATRCRHAHRRRRRQHVGAGRRVRGVRRCAVPSLRSREGAAVRRLAARRDGSTTRSEALLDAKTRLQHYAQEHMAATPVYREVSRGTPQRPEFSSRVTRERQDLGARRAALEESRAAGGRRGRASFDRLPAARRRPQDETQAHQARSDSRRSPSRRCSSSAAASRPSSGPTARASRTSSTRFAGCWARRRARACAAAKLEDVIFAGNETRKPLGLAEVSVAFDNADGRLPIEFAEVEITRRAYRAGESEYFINRAQVRLRDIVDLLMGTGLGPGSYAIVSQGQIDAILTQQADRAPRALRRDRGHRQVPRAQARVAAPSRTDRAERDSHQRSHRRARAAHPRTRNAGATCAPLPQRDRSRPRPRDPRLPARRRVAPRGVRVAARRVREERRAARRRRREGGVAR